MHFVLGASNDKEKANRGKNWDFSSSLGYSRMFICDKYGSQVRRTLLGKVQHCPVLF